MAWHWAVAKFTITVQFWIALNHFLTYPSGRKVEKRELDCYVMGKSWNYIAVRSSHQYLNSWPYLEIESLQMQSGKVRPNYSSCTPIPVWLLSFLENHSAPTPWFWLICLLNFEKIYFSFLKPTNVVDGHGSPKN
jgi:hypothetical protein